MLALFTIRSTKKNEILLKALDVALGIAFGITGNLLFPLLALLFSRNRLVFVAATLFAFLAAPPLPEITAPATVKITAITRENHPFRPRMKYRGIIETIQGKKINFPCVFTLQPKRTKRLTSDRITFKTMRGKKISSGLVVITPGNIPPHEKTFSLAQKRYDLKQKVAHYLKKHYPSRRTHALMTTFATGFSTDTLLKYEFSRLGLQHILSISGLHFGVIALVLSKIISLFTKKRLRHIILLILLSIYVAFLGSTPSVTRTFIALLYYIGGSFLGRRPHAENALGVALLFSLLLAPRSLFDIGLQLSFVATYGIIKLYPKIRGFFPKDGPFYEKIPYAATSLSLSVNALVLPLILYHFHKIPLISFIANLFIPQLLMVSLVLLMLGLHPLNELYTSYALLPVTYHPLLPTLTVPAFPFALTLIPIILTLDVIPIFRENVRLIPWRE